MKRRKDGRWLKVVAVNGKKLYFYSTADTERKAENDIKKQLLAYKEEEERGKTFEEAAEEWSRDHFEKIENNTIKGYRPALRAAIDFFGNTYIKKITPQDIEKYVRYLTVRDYAYKTVKNRLLIVNLVFKYAVIEGMVDNNPCQYIKIPRNLRRTQRRPLSDDEIEIIKSSIDESEECFLAAFILFTGCRRGEVFALTYNDIDFDNRTLRINKTVEWLGNIPQIKNHPKSDAGIRTIPIPTVLFDRLLKRKNKKGYIFPNKYGDLMHDTQASSFWDEFRKQKNINVTPHQLRHTYASILYDANIDVKTAQNLMGHADVQTTMNIYTHLFESRKESAAIKLDNYLEESLKLVNA